MCVRQTMSGPKMAVYFVDIATPHCFVAQVDAVRQEEIFEQDSVILCHFLCRL
jgi:hypothetical protein